MFTYHEIPCNLYYRTEMAQYSYIPGDQDRGCVQMQGGSQLSLKLLISLFALPDPSYFLPLFQVIDNLYDIGVNGI